MAGADRIQAPDLPAELMSEPLGAGDGDRDGDGEGDLQLTGVLVEQAQVRARRLRITESELRGVVLEVPSASGMALRDVILRGCGLSNARAREATIRRVAAIQCRLVGLDVGGGEIADLRVSDSSLKLASFAGARLRDVAFEDCNLSETSFLEARLEHVRFVGCDLTGADFRGARCTGCEIRGASLHGVLGVEALRGVRMPWSDVVASAAALAQALGIQIAD